MQKITLLSFSLCWFLFSIAQKKPLDHTVYDGWQTVGEKKVSNDGKWIVCTIDPQEGDGELVIQSSDARYKKIIPRGDTAVITEDSRFVICRIKPFFRETREAKIKKRSRDNFPKDSLAIIELGTDNVWKRASVRTFKTPDRSFGWVAYHLYKRNSPVRNRVADSLGRIIDSLRAALASSQGKSVKDDHATFDDDSVSTSRDTIAAIMVLRNLQTGEEKSFRDVVQYSFSKNGKRLLMEQASDPKNRLSKMLVLYYNIEKGTADTLSNGGNDFKNFAIAEDGTQVAYLAERDAMPKDLQKLYKLWYYKEGMDSAMLLADKNTAGMKVGMTVSEFGNVKFSKSGKRLFFGTAEISPPKDTSLVDIDLARVDVWHYNDDYLQPVQLKRLRQKQQENFLAVYDFGLHKMEQLGTREIPLVIQTDEGDGEQFVGVTDFGRRIESQWEGETKKDIYAINVSDGSRKLVKKELDGLVLSSYMSPTGKYIMWYDSKARHYFVWNGRFVKNITVSIKAPLYDEEHDSPSDPSPYGIMGWHEGDSAVYIYDRYDIWKIDPAGLRDTSCLTLQQGRKTRTTYRYILLDSTKKFFKNGDDVLVKAFDNTTKEWGFGEIVMGNRFFTEINGSKRNYSIGTVAKAKEGTTLIYTRENYTASPDLYAAFQASVYHFSNPNALTGFQLAETKLSSINLQQGDYNWGTAELFRWKAYNGKETEGIVYKPEDFDPKKKYPLICYFYETLSNGLNNYLPPAPTPSRLNIPFFVSRGYIVLAPDIHYGTGHPGRDAYDHVVSGARALVKKGFIDSTKMGIQGQSWGGYQVAYIITVTNLFKAAWAGAPVANMTSAYGGIRWETGLNRQFQYEKTQSRIGATLWEKPQLYIDNSPLFKLPKVQTPLVIMSNDADGAVPWYQGIEMFTAMRRLGKKVWLLNYNGEAHNLVERRNRKDIQIREQQYFDWLLKGEKPARWITEGVPAVNKGRDWGLD